MDYYFGNPNPNPYYTHSAVNVNTAPPPPSSDFMLSDYLLLDDVVDHHDHHQESWSQSTETGSSDKAAASSNAILGFGDHETSINNNNNIKRKSGIKRNSTVEVRPRITFRTRSQLEIMDDGYKWRKYGKKRVKNSPNPRNYYKCSGEGCGVKKRVERDREDSTYVLTTYDGVHNHQSPCNTYYSPIPLVHSNEWTLQATANSCSN